MQTAIRPYWKSKGSVVTAPPFALTAAAATSVSSTVSTIPHPGGVSASCPIPPLGISSPGALNMAYGISSVE